MGRGLPVHSLWALDPSVIITSSHSRLASQVSNSRTSWDNWVVRHWTLVVGSLSISPGLATIETILHSHVTRPTSHVQNHVQRLTTLTGRFDQHQTALGAGYGSFDGQQVAVGVHFNHFKVLHRYPLYTHVTGKLSPLIYPGWAFRSQ